MIDRTNLETLRAAQFLKQQVVDDIRNRAADEIEALRAQLLSIQCASPLD